MVQVCTLNCHSTLVAPYPPVVTRCYHVVITDADVLYTVNGVANANEHGPFQNATTATRN